jgi:exosortase
MNRLESHALAPWAILVLLVALSFSAFSLSLRDLMQIGINDPGKGYILLVPLVAAYLFWLRRSRLVGEMIGPSNYGPLIILAGGIAYWIGIYFDLMFLWHASGIIAIIGAVVTVFGHRLLAAFAPAFLVTFAMVPIPGRVQIALAQPLQGFASGFTAIVLDLVSVPAVRMGNTIEINGALVAVGEACNGMRLLVPLGLVMFVFVYSLPLKPAIRVSLLVASVPVALICNVLRLVPTSLAYGYYPESAIFVHDVGGWMMLPLAIVILVTLVRVIEWLDISVSRWRLVTA